jgi:F1F0 ATPase subunit 2
MNWIAITFSLVGGIFLGIFYFGGLWLTIRNLTATRYPALITMGSFLARTLLTLAGFYFIMGGRLENLLTCLFGFLLVRQVLFKVVQDGKTGSALL